MLSLSQLTRFIRTDVLWVITGQFIALIVGLLSLKIFTTLFSAQEYAFIALMMALSGWIWTGLYLPLNQTIFRFYSLSLEQGWQNTFFSYIWHYEKRVAALVAGIALVLLMYGLVTSQADSFLWLVILSSVLGVMYGVIHGSVSFFVAQRRRKPITLIQSCDGAMRLAGGLIAFYWVSQSVFVTATGMVAAGIVVFIVVVWFLMKQISVDGDAEIPLRSKENQHAFSSYFKKMGGVMMLNASIIHLDKWLLLPLLGAEGLGQYAAVYLLAMTITAIMYAFFEMLAFPLILNQSSEKRRQKYQRLTTLSYTVCLVLIVSIIHLFGYELLLFLTTDYVANQYETFTLLVLACGLLNLGRVTMVQGQVDLQPHKYWPAYLVLLCFFISWCLLFVGVDGGTIAAQGYVYGTLLFVVITAMLNKRKVQQ